MIHGPALDTLKDAAKTAVMNHYVGIAESDGTPPTLRAMYVLKTIEARKVLAGEASDYITAEAARRNITPEAMAQMIADLAKQSEDLELARMTANIAIDAAEDAAGVVAVTEPLGITFSVEV